jgi:hypothetical protein
LGLAVWLPATQPASLEIFFFSLELFGLGLGLGLRLGLDKFGTEVQEIYIHIYMLDRHMHAFSSFDVLGQFNPNPKPLY